jgi:hypothetical protein
MKTIKKLFIFIKTSCEYFIENKKIKKGDNLSLMYSTSHPILGKINHYINTFTVVSDGQTKFFIPYRLSKAEEETALFYLNGQMRLYKTDYRFKNNYLIWNNPNDLILLADKKLIFREKLKINMATLEEADDKDILQ